MDTNYGKFYVATCFTGGSTQKEANENAAKLVTVHQEVSERLASGWTLQRHEIVPLANGEALIYFWLTNLPE